MKLDKPILTVKHIEEPKISMKDGINLPEPKMAWTLLGSNQKKNAETTINLGVIGDKDSIDGFAEFLQRAQTPSKGKADTLLHVSFPGLEKLKIKFNLDLKAEILSSELESLKKTKSFSDRILISEEIIQKKIKSLMEREPSPDLLVLAYPKIIDQYCIEGAIGKRKAHKKTRLEKYIERKRAINQTLENFIDMQPPKMKYEPVDLRSLVKLECMKYDIPIQIIRPSTCEPFNVEKPKREDDATTFWNLIIAMFYKANNIPWSVKGIMEDTCYIGITFFRDRRDSSNVKTSLAQIFSLNTEGYVIKGDHAILDEKNTPHVSGKEAFNLIKKAVDVYKRNNDGMIPKRIVVHKSSKYTVDEKEGFLAGAEGIPKRDLLAFGTRNIKLIRWGKHPPIRGTMVKLPDNSMLLYTSGYVPYLEVYPGPRVPSPLEILEYSGDTTMDIIGKEILALTKLNWNSAKFYIKAPITIAFSRRVGGILREIPPDMDPKEIGTKFKFYM